MALIAASFHACKPANNPEGIPGDGFEVLVDEFADIQVLRYKVNGFDELTPQQKELCYYLYMAAQSGRDIIWDQNYKYNLTVRKALEQIVETYEGLRQGKEWDAFTEYSKRVWFSNGIHHHYSSKKIMPEFSKTYFEELVIKSKRGKFPLQKGQDLKAFADFLTPILFDPNIAPKKVNQESNVDNIKTSANNFYENVTKAEVENFYKSIQGGDKEKPLAYGLNSKMVKENGNLVEKVWKVGGMYTQAIEKIVFWLEKAEKVAENEKQQKALNLLIQFYKTGDLKTWDDYNIAWVQDVDSRIDVVNGFIEVYGDAIGYRASYESVVSIKDMEASKLIAKIAKEAQWFEDNSPLKPEHKKEKVTGISAKVITVVTEAGDAAPATPIGINLPNSNWVRQVHGSKSVSLGNIVHAYNEMTSRGSSIDEFAYTKEEVERAKKFGALAADLHTDMHEVIGHASGKLNPGVKEPNETLIQYASTLEEARADLVALYYIMDKKLVDMGVMPSLEVGKTEYESYIRNGMMLQLRRIDVGDNLEESHMRNRQLVASWAFEKGAAKNVVERKVKDGKTYFVVNDFEALRVIFGDLLREIQRIKSEGDFKSAEKLVENYGVKVDEKLKLEVKDRFAKIKSRPYNGFMQPKLVPIMDGDKMKDVRIKYPANFVNQMLEYGSDFGFLPPIN